MVRCDDKRQCELACRLMQRCVANLPRLRFERRPNWHGYPLNDTCNRRAAAPLSNIVGDKAGSRLQAVINMHDYDAGRPKRHGRSVDQHQ